MVDTKRSDDTDVLSEQKSHHSEIIVVPKKISRTAFPMSVKTFFILLPS